MDAFPTALLPVPASFMSLETGSLRVAPGGWLPTAGPGHLFQIHALSLEATVQGLMARGSSGQWAKPWFGEIFLGS